MGGPDLFGNIAIGDIKTEGVKYAGSKLKLLPYILEMVSTVSPITVLDAFSGSTRVSQALAKSGHTVFSNDISEWSETFAQCYLLNEKPEKYFAQILEHLNNLSPVNGGFTEH